MTKMWPPQDHSSCVAAFFKEVSHVMIRDKRMEVLKP